MSQPVDPIRRARATRRTGERRADERRGDERRAESAAEAEAPVANLPAVIPDTAEPPKPAPSAAAAYAAQLLGQEGQKRGLRGGPQVLGSARAAYLDAEYLGPAERRATKGQITKTEI